MKDKTYYRIMTWLGWFILGLWAIEIILWIFGPYPEMSWKNMDSPMLALNILLMIRIMKGKDRIIEIQDGIIEELKKWSDWFWPFS